MISVSTQDDSERNIFNGVSVDIIQSLFDVKEHFFYYKNFNNVSRRRDFAPVFIACVTKFLTADTRDIQSLYQLYVKPSREVRSPVRSSGLYRSNWPRFSEFFPQSAVSDLKLAKLAYRKAALLLHPDHGGCSDEMMLLNSEAARLFDYLLLEKFETGICENHTKNSSFGLYPVEHGFWPGTVLQYPQCFIEFEILLRTEALLAAEDIFEEDTHSDLALGITFNQEWIVLQSDGEYEAISKAEACYEISGIILRSIEAAVENNHACILLKLQSLGREWSESSVDGFIKHGRMVAQKEKSIAQVRAIEKTALSKGRLPFIESDDEECLRYRTASIQNPKSQSNTNRTMTHILQAENAFRRGLITRSRYMSAIERFNKRRAEHLESEKEINMFQNDIGFMKLEHDPEKLEKRTVTRYVPEGNQNNAFGKWVFGSPEACRAYSDAFYCNLEIEGKIIYIRQRLWILLSSIIGFPHLWNTERIRAAAAEVEILRKAARVAKEGEAHNHASELYAFLTHLANEPDDVRDERLRLLGCIGCEDFQDDLPLGVRPRVDRKSMSTGSVGYSPLWKIVPSSLYYRAAVRPIKYLQDLTKGEEWTQNEPEGNWTVSEYYFKNMRDHQWKMFSAAQIKSPLTKVFELNKLIRCAIEWPVPLDAAGDWCLGYYIENLTNALMRMKKVSDAKEFIDKYFSLPDSYRERSTVSCDKVLRDRLAKCNRDAAKNRADTP